MYPLFDIDDVPPFFKMYPLILADVPPYFLFLGSCPAIFKIISELACSHFEFCQNQFLPAATQVYISAILFLLLLGSKAFSTRNLSSFNQLTLTHVLFIVVHCRHFAFIMKHIFYVFT